MHSLRVVTLLLAAAAAGAPLLRGQEETPADPERSRFLVREAPEFFPDRTAHLGRIRAAILARAAPAELATRIAAFESAAEGARAALRRAVEAVGGTVEHTHLVGTAATVSLPPGAAERLRADPVVGEVVAERRHGAHIRVSTNAANHAADVVQATWPTMRGRGATLALLDSGIDLECAATGSPHPAFLDPARGDATRIAAAFGFASTRDREDRIGHGTAVAGVAVARDWDAGPLGDDGFAPEARVASFKITRDGGSTYADGDLLAALDAVARERLRLDLLVLNLSWAGVPSPTYVTQRALDEVAHFFDVVVVVSAGNDGHLPNPTARSHGCTNALAVGAVHGDTHAVWERSAYGPLLGDPERIWPDLAAVGVGLRAPAPDRPAGESVPLSGTSFAAPAVAGTALVLRAWEPSLTAPETRAILLASAADVAAANPGLGRPYHGLGLLRTDLAAETLRSGSRYRGTITPGAPDADVAIEPPAGRSMVAVLAWDRTDVFRTDWDDLDLEVTAPDGRIVAVSDSARNLYERVVFVADRPGAYRIGVHGREVPSGVVDWTLVVAESRGGARQPGSYRAFGTACTGVGVDPARGVQLPAFAAGRFGTAKMELPLAGPPGRLLQILDGTTLPPDLTVRAIALRRDETSLGVPGWRVDLTVRMGHTSRAPSSPLANFDRNFEDPFESSPVLDARALDLPGVTELPSTPDQLDFVLPLDRPFVPRTDGGRNVVVDFQLHGHSRSSASFGLFLDAELDTRTASVTAIGDPRATTGIPDPVGLVLALLDGATTPAAPWLSPDRLPQLGEVMQAVLREARPHAVAALVHGQDNGSWGSHALPLPLDGLGAPGCALLVRPDVLLPATVGVGGQAAVDVAIPADPAWTGVTFYQQFLVLDPAANALGISASGGGAGRVGM